MRAIVRRPFILVFARLLPLVFGQNELQANSKIPFGETYRDYDPSSVLRLGMTYNIEKETFFSRQVLSATDSEDNSLNPAASWQGIHLLKYNYGIQKSEKDVVDSLGVNGDMVMSAYSGKVQGSLSGRFMTDTRSYDSKTIITTDINFVTGIHSLDPNLVRTNPTEYERAIELGATHFVREIIYGGRFISSMEFDKSDSAESMVIQAYGKLKLYLEGQGGDMGSGELGEEEDDEGEESGEMTSGDESSDEDPGPDADEEVGDDAIPDFEERDVDNFCSYEPAAEEETDETEEASAEGEEEESGDDTPPEEEDSGTVINVEGCIDINNQALSSTSNLKINVYAWPGALKTPYSLEALVRVIAGYPDFIRSTRYGRGSAIGFILSPIYEIAPTSLDRLFFMPSQIQTNMVINMVQDMKESDTLFRNKVEMLDNYERVTRTRDSGLVLDKLMQRVVRVKIKLIEAIKESLTQLRSPQLDLSGATGAYYSSEVFESTLPPCKTGPGRHLREITNAFTIVESCASFPSPYCNGNGNCVIRDIGEQSAPDAICTGATASCDCLVGYFGEFCEFNVCDDSNPCGYDGICKLNPAKTDGYECECKNGMDLFNGICSKNTCDSNPNICKHGKCFPRNKKKHMYDMFIANITLQFDGLDVNGDGHLNYTELYNILDNHGRSNSADSMAAYYNAHEWLNFILEENKDRLNQPMHSDYWKYCNETRYDQEWADWVHPGTPYTGPDGRRKRSSGMKVLESPIQSRSKRRTKRRKKGKKRSANLYNLDVLTNTANTAARVPKRMNLGMDDEEEIQPARTGNLTRSLAIANNWEAPPEAAMKVHVVFEALGKYYQGCERQINKTELLNYFITRNQENDIDTASDFYFCECDPGWSGWNCDLHYCQDEAEKRQEHNLKIENGELAAGTPFVSPVCGHGVCTETAAGQVGYQCQCNIGWYGVKCDRSACEETSPCRATPADMSMTCTPGSPDNSAQFTCDCNTNILSEQTYANYHVASGGKYRIPYFGKSDCRNSVCREANPCDNYSKCVDTNTGPHFYQCMCLEDSWSDPDGPFICQHNRCTAANPNTGEPKLECGHGYCEFNMHGARCSCEPNYFGENCQYFAGQTDPEMPTDDEVPDGRNFCQNGGSLTTKRNMKLASLIYSVIHEKFWDATWHGHYEDRRELGQADFGADHFNASYAHADFDSFNSFAESELTNRILEKVVGYIESSPVAIDYKTNEDSWPSNGALQAAIIEELKVDNIFIESWLSKIKRNPRKVEEQGDLSVCDVAFGSMDAPDDFDDGGESETEGVDYGDTGLGVGSEVQCSDNPPDDFDMSDIYNSTRFLDVLNELDNTDFEGTFESNDKIGNFILEIEQGIKNNGPECLCRAGYVNGYNNRCEVNQCSNFAANSCEHGSLCITDRNNTERGYTCRCKVGYYGDLCEKHLCENPATCNGDQHRCIKTETNGEDAGFICQCKNGFYGTKCEWNTLCPEEGALALTTGTSHTYGIDRFLKYCTNAAGIAQIEDKVALDEKTETYHPCHPDCETCSHGFSVLSCNSCRDGKKKNQRIGEAVCEDTCQLSRTEDLPYSLYYIDQEETTCNVCPVQCDGCTGDSVNDCIDFSYQQDCEIKLLIETMFTESHPDGVIPGVSENQEMWNRQNLDIQAEIHWESDTAATELITIVAKYNGISTFCMDYPETHGLNYKTLRVRALRLQIASGAWFVKNVKVMYADQPEGQSLVLSQTGSATRAAGEFGNVLLVPEKASSNQVQSPTSCPANMMHTLVRKVGQDLDLLDQATRDNLKTFSTRALFVKHGYISGMKTYGDKFDTQVRIDSTYDWERSTDKILRGIDFQLDDRDDTNNNPDLANAKPTSWAATSSTGDPTSMFGEYPTSAERADSSLFNSIADMNIITDFEVRGYHKEYDGNVGNKFFFFTYLKLITASGAQTVSFGDSNAGESINWKAFNETRPNEYALGTHGETGAEHLAFIDGVYYDHPNDGNTVNSARQIVQLSFYKCMNRIQMLEQQNRQDFSGEEDDSNTTDQILLDKDIFTDENEPAQYNDRWPMNTDSVGACTGRCDMTPSDDDYVNLCFNIKSTAAQFKSKDFVRIGQKVYHYTDNDRFTRGEAAGYCKSILPYQQDSGSFSIFCPESQFEVDMLGNHIYGRSPNTYFHSGVVGVDNVRNLQQTGAHEYQYMCEGSGIAYDGEFAPWNYWNGLAACAAPADPLNGFGFELKGELAAYVLLTTHTENIDPSYFRVGDVSGSRGQDFFEIRLGSDVRISQTFQQADATNDVIAEADFQDNLQKDRRIPFSIEWHGDDLVVTRECQEIMRLKDYARKINGKTITQAFFSTGLGSDAFWRFGQNQMINSGDSFGYRAAMHWMSNFDVTNQPACARVTNPKKGFGAEVRVQDNVRGHTYLTFTTDEAGFIDPNFLPSDDLNRDTLVFEIGTTSMHLKRGKSGRRIASNFNIQMPRNSYSQFRFEWHTLDFVVYSNVNGACGEVLRLANWRDHTTSKDITQVHFGAHDPGHVIKYGNDLSTSSQSSDSQNARFITVWSFVNVGVDARSMNEIATARTRAVEGEDIHFMMKLTQAQTFEYQYINITDSMSDSRGGVLCELNCNLVYAHATHIVEEQGVSIDLTPNFLSEMDREQFCEMYDEPENWGDVRDFKRTCVYYNCPVKTHSLIQDKSGCVERTIPQCGQYRKKTIFDVFAEEDMNTTPFALQRIEGNQPLDETRTAGDCRRSDLGDDGFYLGISPGEDPSNDIDARHFAPCRPSGHGMDDNETPLPLHMLFYLHEDDADRFVCSFEQHYPDGCITEAQFVGFAKYYRVLDKYGNVMNEDTETDLYWDEIICHTCHDEFNLAATVFRVNTRKKCVQEIPECIAYSEDGCEKCGNDAQLTDTKNHCVPENLLIEGCEIHGDPIPQFDENGVQTGHRFTCVLCTNGALQSDGFTCRQLCEGNMCARLDQGYANIDYSHLHPIFPGTRIADGRLEVTTDRGHVWSTVCDRRFDIRDATASCKTMGFNEGSAVYKINAQQYDITDLPEHVTNKRISLQGMNCTVTDADLDACMQNVPAEHADWVYQEPKPLTVGAGYQSDTYIDRSDRDGSAYVYAGDDRDKNDTCTGGSRTPDSTDCKTREFHLEFNMQLSVSRVKIMPTCNTNSGNSICETSMLLLGVTYENWIGEVGECQFEPDSVYDRAQGRFAFGNEVQAGHPFTFVCSTTTTRQPMKRLIVRNEEDQTLFINREETVYDYWKIPEDPSFCDHREDIGLQCYTKKHITDMKDDDSDAEIAVRLLGDHSYGIVEMSRDNGYSFSPVGTSGFDNEKAHFVCSKLGFQGGVDSSTWTTPRKFENLKYSYWSRYYKQRCDDLNDQRACKIVNDRGIEGDEKADERMINIIECDGLPKEVSCDFFMRDCQPNSEKFPLGPEIWSEGDKVQGGSTHYFPEPMKVQLDSGIYTIDFITIMADSDGRGDSKNAFRFREPGENPAIYDLDVIYSKGRLNMNSAADIYVTFIERDHEKFVPLTHEFFMTPTFTPDFIVVITMKSISNEYNDYQIFIGFADQKRIQTVIATSRRNKGIDLPGEAGLSIPVGFNWERQQVTYRNWEFSPAAALLHQDFTFDEVILDCDDCNHQLSDIFCFSANGFVFLGDCAEVPEYSKDFGHGFRQVPVFYTDLDPSLVGGMKKRIDDEIPAFLNGRLRGNPVLKEGTKVYTVTAYNIPGSVVAENYASSDKATFQVTMFELDAGYVIVVTYGSLSWSQDYKLLPKQDGEDGDFNIYDVNERTVIFKREDLQNHVSLANRYTGDLGVDFIVAVRDEQEQLDCAMGGVDEFGVFHEVLLDTREKSWCADYSFRSTCSNVEHQDPIYSKCICPCNRAFNVSSFSVLPHNTRLISKYHKAETSYAETMRINDVFGIDNTNANSWYSVITELYEDGSALQMIIQPDEPFFIIYDAFNLKSTLSLNYRSTVGSTITHEIHPHPLSQHTYTKFENLNSFYSLSALAGKCDVVIRDERRNIAQNDTRGWDDIDAGSESVRAIIADHKPPNQHNYGWQDNELIIAPTDAYGRVVSFTVLDVECGDGSARLVAYDGPKMYNPQIGSLCDENQESLTFTSTGPLMLLKIFGDATQITFNATYSVGFPQTYAAVSCYPTTGCQGDNCVRLVGAGQYNAGRVQVSYDNGDSWKEVVSGVSPDTANVLCRQAGFERAKTAQYVGALSADGSEEFVDISCTGAEIDFGRCSNEVPMPVPVNFDSWMLRFFELNDGDALMIAIGQAFFSHDDSMVIYDEILNDKRLAAWNVANRDVTTGTMNLCRNGQCICYDELRKSFTVEAEASVGDSCNLSVSDEGFLKMGSDCFALDNGVFNRQECETEYLAHFVHVRSLLFTNSVQALICYNGEQRYDNDQEIIAVHNRGYQGSEEVNNRFYGSREMCPFFGTAFDFAFPFGETTRDAYDAYLDSQSDVNFWIQNRNLQDGTSPLQGQEIIDCFHYKYAGGLNQQNQRHNYGSMTGHRVDVLLRTKTRDDPKQDIVVVKVSTEFYVGNWKNGELSVDSEYRKLEETTYFVITENEIRPWGATINEFQSDTFPRARNYAYGANTRYDPLTTIAGDFVTWFNINIKRVEDLDQFSFLENLRGYQFAEGLSSTQSWSFLEDGTEKETSIADQSSAHLRHVGEVISSPNFDVSFDMEVDYDIRNHQERGAVSIVHSSNGQISIRLGFLAKPENSDVARNPKLLYRPFVQAGEDVNSRIEVTALKTSNGFEDSIGFINDRTMYTYRIRVMSGVMRFYIDGIEQGEAPVSADSYYVAGRSQPTYISVGNSPMVTGPFESENTVRVTKATYTQLNDYSDSNSNLERKIFEYIGERDSQGRPDGFGTLLLSKSEDSNTLMELGTDEAENYAMRTEGTCHGVESTDEVRKYMCFNGEFNHGNPVRGQLILWNDDHDATEFEGSFVQDKIFSQDGLVLDSGTLLRHLTINFDSDLVWSVGRNKRQTTEDYYVMYQGQFNHPDGSESVFKDGVFGFYDSQENLYVRIEGRYVDGPIAGEKFYDGVLNQYNHHANHTNDVTQVTSLFKNVPYYLNDFLYLGTQRKKIVVAGSEITYTTKRTKSVGAFENHHADTNEDQDIEIVTVLRANDASSQFNKGEFRHMQQHYFIDGVRIGYCSLAQQAADEATNVYLGSFPTNEFSFDKIQWNNVAAQGSCSKYNEDTGNVAVLIDGVFELSSDTVYWPTPRNVDYKFKDGNGNDVITIVYMNTNLGSQYRVTQVSNMVDMDEETPTVIPRYINDFETLGKNFPFEICQDENGNTVSENEGFIIDVDHRFTCDPINECDDASTNTCPSDTTCEDHTPGYFCRCHDEENSWWNPISSSCVTFSKPILTLTTRSGGLSEKPESDSVRYFYNENGFSDVPSSVELVYSNKNSPSQCSAKCRSGVLAPTRTVTYALSESESVFSSSIKAENVPAELNFYEECNTHFCTWPDASFATFKVQTGNNTEDFCESESTMFSHSWAQDYSGDTGRVLAIETKLESESLTLEGSAVRFCNQHGYNNPAMLSQFKPADREYCVLSIDGSCPSGLVSYSYALFQKNKDADNIRLSMYQYSLQADENKFHDMIMGAEDLGTDNVKQEQGKPFVSGLEWSRGDYQLGFRFCCSMSTENHDFEGPAEAFSLVKKNPDEECPGISGRSVETATFEYRVKDLQNAVDDDSNSESEYYYYYYEDENTDSDSESYYNENYAIKKRKRRGARQESQNYLYSYIVADTSNPDDSGPLSVSFVDPEFHTYSWQVCAYSSLSFWSEWSEWDHLACQICGSDRERTRTRTCLSGSTGQATNSEKCPGDGEETANCGLPDCKFTDWSDWSECSADPCDSSTVIHETKTRSRDCGNLASRIYLGEDDDTCGTEKSQTVPCTWNTDSCYLKTKSYGEAISSAQNAISKHYQVLSIDAREGCTGEFTTNAGAYSDIVPSFIKKAKGMSLANPHSERVSKKFFRCPVTSRRATVLPVVDQTYCVMTDSVCEIGTHVNAYSAGYGSFTLCCQFETDSSKQLHMSEDSVIFSVNSNCPTAFGRKSKMAGLYDAYATNADMNDSVGISLCLYENAPENAQTVHLASFENLSDKNSAMLSDTFNYNAHQSHALCSKDGEFGDHFNGKCSVENGAIVEMKNVRLTSDKPAGESESFAGICLDIKSGDFVSFGHITRTSTESSRKKRQAYNFLADQEDEEPVTGETPDHKDTVDDGDPLSQLLAMESAGQPLSDEQMERIRLHKEAEQAVSTDLPPTEDGYLCSYKSASGETLTSSVFRFVEIFTDDTNNLEYRRMVIDNTRSKRDIGCAHYEIGTYGTHKYMGLVQVDSHCACEVGYGLDTDGSTCTPCEDLVSMSITVNGKSKSLVMVNKCTFDSFQYCKTFEGYSGYWFNNECVFTSYDSVTGETVQSSTDRAVVPNVYSIGESIDSEFYNGEEGVAVCTMVGGINMFGTLVMKDNEHWCVSNGIMTTNFQVYSFASSEWSTWGDCHSGFQKRTRDEVAGQDSEEYRKCTFRATETGGFEIGSLFNLEEGYVSFTGNNEGITHRAGPHPVAFGPNGEICHVYIEDHCMAISNLCFYKSPTSDEISTGYVEDTGIFRFDIPEESDKFNINGQEHMIDIFDMDASIMMYSKPETNEDGERIVTLGSYQRCDYEDRELNSWSELCETPYGYGYIKKEGGYDVCFFVDNRGNGFAIDERNRYDQMISNPSAPVSFTYFKMVDNFSYVASDENGDVDDEDAIENAGGKQLAVCLAEEGQYFGTRDPITGKCMYIDNEREVQESKHFILVIGESYIEDAGEEIEENVYDPEAALAALEEQEAAEAEQLAASEERNRVFENTIFSSLLNKTKDNNSDGVDLLDFAPEDVIEEAQMLTQE